MRTLYLNLDSRPDRRAEAEAEFQRVGLTVERVAAIGGDNPMLAFNQSVYKAMEMAMGEDLLLFEDDVVFDGPLYKGDDNIRFFSYPGDALTVHLGCNFLAQWEMPKPYNNNMARLPNCWQSHATYYSKECVDFILDNMRTDIMTEEHCIFDEWLRKNVLSQGRSYVMRPMIAYQRPSKSDIWNCQADYTQCHIDGNKWLMQHT
jgi:hypothetical protein